MSNTPNEEKQTTSRKQNNNKLHLYSQQKTNFLAVFDSVAKAISRIRFH